MRFCLVLTLTIAMAIGTSCDSEETRRASETVIKGKEKPVVRFETTLGTFDIELYPAKTPKTVANFLQYVEEGFFDGTIFHRVVPGFVIQGGGFNESLKKKPTRDPIENEAAIGVTNARGTVAMARTYVRDSATSQFYVSLKDNSKSLDYKGESPEGWGYCAFGKVIEGLDVVDKIGAVSTTTKAQMPDVPVETVKIIKASLVK